MYEWTKVAAYIKAGCVLGDDIHWHWPNPMKTGLSMKNFATPDNKTPDVKRRVTVWLAMARAQRYFVENEEDVQVRHTCSDADCVNHILALQLMTMSVTEFDEQNYVHACERFQQYCDPPSAETGCVLWNGPVEMHGYGVFTFCGKTLRAHVVSWQLCNIKDVPKGLVVRHMCGGINKNCVNGAHLEIGTYGDNSADEDRFGKRKLGEKRSHAKMTNATAQAIVDSFGNGKTQAERAADFGVKINVIDSIDAALTWKHLMTPEQVKIRHDRQRQKLAWTLEREKIRKIKASKGTKSVKDRAKEFGVCERFVYKIDTGTSHSNVLVDEKDDLKQQALEEKQQLEAAKTRTHGKARLGFSRELIRHIKWTKDEWPMSKRVKLFGISERFIYQLDAGKAYKNVMLDEREDVKQLEKEKQTRLDASCESAKKAIARKCTKWTSPKDGKEHLLWDNNKTTVEIPRPAMGFLGKSYSAHRVSWMAHNRTATRPPGKPYILHSCRYKFCVEPTHLRAGTAAENALDKFKDGTMSKLLDEAKVKEILASDKDVDTLAAFYKVKPDTIKNILAKRTWKHLSVVSSK